MEDELLAQELESLKISYIESLSERFNDIEGMILSLKGDSNQSKILRVMTGDFHSIKGAAGSYGVHFITKASHATEDFLIKLLSGKKYDSQAADVLLKFVDIMQNYTIQLKQGNEAALKNLEIQLADHIKEIHGETIRILVVEPTKSLMRIYQEAVKNKNCSFTFANNGLEAFQRALQEKFDYMIISRNSSVLNGLEIVKCLKNLDRPKIKLETILVSAEDKVDGQVKADHYVHKGPDMVAQVRSIIK